MATRRRKPVSEPPEVIPRGQSKYVEAAGEIKGWTPASEMLDEVSSVQTCFPDFNRATRVGGLPTRRIITVHGPTHGGKSALVLGLVKSFVDVGFVAGYVDAEHSLDKHFVGELVPNLQHMPNFLARRPETYEETIDAVNAFLTRAEKVKTEHPEHRAILVVDSINKLVPKKELDKLLKASKGGEELAKGHHGMLRAALNQAWLDQLTPKIYRADCAMVFVAQEREDHDSGMFGGWNDFKVKGGSALLFDASLVARVSKGSPIFLGTEKANDQICGFAHRVRIWKSKVGHMDGRYTDCVFHTSNGRLSPPGFDTARDAIIVGKSLGLVHGDGWLTVGNKRYQGMNLAVKGLSGDPERLGKLLADIAREVGKQEGRDL